jgi:LPS O-antigen subunit length determinant protein (WzzB/FepE family)
MNINEKELREIIRNTIQDVNESDLITKRSNKTWSEHKSELNNNIKDVINFIEDDVYDEKDGVEKIVNKIDDSIEVLKSWKSKVKKGGEKKDVIDEEEF